MALKVRLHARARSDLRGIRDYLLQHAGAAAADRVRAHLLQKIMRLATSPNIGTQSSNPEVRILPPTRYPYRVYYTATAEAVIVLHIRHTARRDPDPDEIQS